MKTTWKTGLFIGLLLAGCIIKTSNPPPGPYGPSNGNNGGGEYSGGGNSGTTADCLDAEGRSQPCPAGADDNMPIGAPVRGQGRATDGTETCAGVGCGFDCPGGNCRFFCTKHASCDISCAGGNCSTTCTDDAQCNVDCPGGNCRTVCNDGAECASDCSGGNCLFRCSGPQCHDTCTGGNCST